MLAQILSISEVSNDNDEEEESLKEKKRKNIMKKQNKFMIQKI